MLKQEIKAFSATEAVEKSNVPVLKNVTRSYDKQVVEGGMSEREFFLNTLKKVVKNEENLGVMIESDKGSKDTKLIPYQHVKLPVIYHTKWKKVFEVINTTTNEIMATGTTAKEAKGLAKEITAEYRNDLGTATHVVRAVKVQVLPDAPDQVIYKFGFTYSPSVKATEGTYVVVSL